MATVTNVATWTSNVGHKVIAATVVGTSNYVVETGDYIQYSGVTGANAIIMIHPTGVSNGGYAACWANAKNAMFYYGPGNIGAVGATTYNGQPLLTVGNAVNFATHTFPVIIVCKGD